MAKRNQTSNDPVSKNKSRVIKAGVYDGSFASKDFVVSGHSTGSYDNEMERLSHQVSRDAGAIPAYETDDNFKFFDRTDELRYEGSEEEGDWNDLGGPDLYGPNPSLLGGTEPRSIARTALWSTVALGAVGLGAWAALRLLRGSRLS